MTSWASSAGRARPACAAAGLHLKHAAYTSAVYTLNISLFVIMLYGWRIQVNIEKYKELDDVYYGVQIAYSAIIGTQIFMMVLSILLIYGIYKENIAFIVPWVVGSITFMALEAMAMVYSNVLRDHVNKHFDAICKAEMALQIPRILINSVAIWSVMKLYHRLRAGATWKRPASIEL